MKAKQESKIPKTNKKRLILKFSAIALILLVVILVSLNYSVKEPKKEIKNFEECVQEGYLVLESYPRQCRTPEGRLFVEELSIEESCNSLYGGSWVEQYNECEGLTEEQCLDLEGIYEPCASACRHNPEAKICIAVCVPVCSIPDKL